MNIGPISTYIIFEVLSWCGGWSSFPSIRLVVHPIIHPSIHPSIPSSIPSSIHIRQRAGGKAWALLKLQNSIVSGNCPFCPIYSTIGIHHVMKGYWPIIKISSRHVPEEGSVCNQCNRCNQFFPFLGFEERGKGKIYIYYWGWGSRHSSMEWRRQSCGNLSHSKEVVAKRDRPQVIPTSVVFFFFF